jgi:pimeloyl-ACP methyl ester carboxylesterase
MTPFVKPLQQAGYSVRAVDWPAHGASAGEQINVSVIADILCELQRQDASETIIAHSLGGSAALLAAARGLDASRLVLIAAGGRLDRYPVRFTRAAGMNDTLGEALRDRLFAEFGNDVMFLGESKALEAAFHIPALFVHDLDDAEMPHEESRSLAGRWGANAQLVSTAGLGHTRLLKDQAVLEEVIAFLSRT